MAPFGTGSSDPAEDRADMESALENNQKYTQKLMDILNLLLEQGSFFESAIELDTHGKDSIGGEEFERRIRKALGK